MIKSMTGFGRAESFTEDLNIVVEVKSLNSKFFDTIIKMPKAFSEKEIEVRNILEKSLVRGKISVAIDYQNKTTGSQPQVINKSLLTKYYNELNSLATKLSDDKADIFRLALYLPDVISPEISNDEIANWEIIKSVMIEAIDYCNVFRTQEGKNLSKELTTYIEEIDKSLGEIDKMDPERIIQIRDRIKSNLAELIPENNYDENRFEQELIYYLEKLDISEEKVRLKGHLDYFLDEMNSPESNGKKLNFISQEIGREINTIGSKANYAPITRSVVLMKDSLEKVKEQLLNIL
ncbi:MAG: YicC/YloC family endoribonuclease [Cyclobacteriaceae bacterium]|jgi:uncharacterized protein (TIGR00255 family)